MEWISVEKDLPSIPEEKASEGCVQVKVLAWNGEDWEEAWYDPNDKKFYDTSDWPGYEIKGVTHWTRPNPPIREQ